MAYTATPLIAYDAGSSLQPASSQRTAANELDAVYAAIPAAAMSS